MTNEEFIKSISLEGEEWRDVVGYDGLYIVSSLGRIVSLGHTQTIHPFGNPQCITTCKWKPKILKPIVHKTNRPTHYFNVALRKDGKCKRMLWHRVVAIAFIDNPHNFPSIDHINGDKSDNRVANLRWCNNVMNMNNPITRQRISQKAKGRPSKLKKKVIGFFPNGNRIYESVQATQKDGFTPNNVASVCRGENATHLGIRWMFLSDYETLINKSKNSQYHD